MSNEPKLNTRQLLPVQIAKHITNLIVNKASPGTKIPTEPELISMFGVSRPTIREAIKILVNNSVLEIVRGKGTYICKDPGLMNDPLGIRFIQDKDLIIFLQETRLVIEPGIAYLAAIRFEDSDIIKIRNIMNNMIINTQANKLDMDDELNFHIAIAKATHNPILHRIIPIITESVTSTYMETRELYSSHQKAANSHQTIFKAIELGKPQIAQEAMRIHLEESLNELKNILNPSKKKKNIERSQNLSQENNHE